MYIYDEELPPCDSTVQYHPQKLDIIDLVNTDKFKEILIYKKEETPPKHYLFYLYKSTYRIESTQEEVSKGIRNNINDEYIFEKELDKTAYKNVK